MWLACVMAAASVASALAASVALAVPAFHAPVLRVLGLGLVFATLALVNVRGVARGTRLVEIVTVAKLLPLLLLTAVGLLWVRPEHLAIAWAAPDRIGTASLTLIFAFVGIEVALVPSGEIRDASRTVPRAVVHPRFRTPWLAILVHAVLVWKLASLGSFGVLALLSNVALLCSYLRCCLAAIELRRRDVRTDGRPFVLPGGPLVPVLACVVLLWLLSHATTQEFVVTGGAVVVAALLFAWRGMRTRAPLVDPV